MDGDESVIGWANTRQWSGEAVVAREVDGGIQFCPCVGQHTNAKHGGEQNYTRVVSRRTQLFQLPPKAPRSSNPW